MRGAQGAFSFPYIPAQFLDGALVLGYVFATLLLKDLHEVLHHTLVVVLASKVGIAVGGNRLVNTTVDGEHENVKGSATLFVVRQAISDGCCGGLVNDTQHIHT